MTAYIQSNMRSRAEFPAIDLNIIVALGIRFILLRYLASHKREIGSISVCVAAVYMWRQ